MEVYEELGRILRKKGQIDIQLLKETFKLDNVGVRKLLLAFLKSEVIKLGTNPTTSKCKYLYKIFSCFEEVKDETEKKEVLKSLKTIKEICYSNNVKFKHLNAIPNYYEQEKKREFDNNEFISRKIIDIIKVTSLKVTYENTSKNPSDMALLSYFIFDLRNLNYIYELLKTFPDYILAHDEKYFIEEVIDKYIELSTKKEYNSDLNYFEKIIKLFISDKNVKIPNSVRVKMLESIKTSLNKNKDSERTVFFLNDMLNILNDNSKSNKSLKEVDYKFDITQTINEEIDVSVDTNSYMDLRHVKTITIDSPHTALYDDACSLEKLENGNYLLAVFVADVASFVPRYSVFDRYAYEKSETIYIPHNVKTMLPEPFTEKLNLISKEDRPTIGHFIVLDEKMNILDFSVKKCLINVDKNYNYEEVVEDIKTDELLKNMYELSSKLHSKHEDKEIYRTIKNLKNVNLNDIGIGSSMIVEFMTLTNCLIAEYFDNHPELSFIFRVNKSTYDKEVFEKIKELTNDKDKINDFKKILDLVFSSSLY
ncbi:MAG: RNB domain-containing ribonuclease, partial [Bacilli bacterium]